jgi:predicted DNA-binding antitoxin AbrB/MazE fold protein
LAGIIIVMTKIHAIFENGVFRPIEPVKVEEGTRIELSFEETPNPTPGEGLRRSFGAWSADAAELDRFVEEARQARKLVRRSSGE